MVWVSVCYGKMSQLIAIAPHTCRDCVSQSALLPGGA
jgi:hypothetical protein